MAESRFYEMAANILRHSIENLRKDRAWHEEKIAELDNDLADLEGKLKELANESK
jgi:prefoldin subunit 5